MHGTLNDATFDCHRARHDAIDAGTSKIAIDLDVMVEKLGYEVIIPVYPDFIKFSQQLQSIRDSIAASRGKRENREMIYASIESAHFPELVRSYHTLRLSEEIVTAQVGRQR
jgi:hypothetical protein